MPNWWEMDVARTEKQGTKMLWVPPSDRYPTTGHEVETTRWAPRVSLQQRHIFFISAAHPWLNKSTTSPENDGCVSAEAFVAIMASMSKILQTHMCIIFL